MRSNQKGTKLLINTLLIDLSICHISHLTDLAQVEECFSRSQGTPLFEPLLGASSGSRGREKHSSAGRLSQNESVFRVKDLTNAQLD